MSVDSSKGQENDLSLSEAAQFLGVAESTLRRWLRDGVLKGRKMGRRWRFPVRELELLKRSGTQPARATVEHVLASLDPRAVALARQARQGQPDPWAEAALGLIAHSLLSSASDLHIEINPSKARIRQRIDGVLTPVTDVELDAARLLVGSLKELVRLGRAPHPLPQSGTAELKLGERELQVNVTTLPTPFGEGATIRIFPKEAMRLRIEKLGLLDEDYKRFLALVNSPSGLILISSPEGHGRTTTAYCIMNYHCRPDRAIISIEDPIEFELSDIVQTQLEPESGYTAEVALKAALRSAPNIIFLSDIKDGKAGSLVCRAAVAGHLVIASLTADNAADAIYRVIQLGVPAPNLISALCASVSQRLVRTICPRCKDTVAPTDKQLSILRSLTTEPPDTVYIGRGCADCYNTGFKGRIALFEILEIGPRVRELVLNHASPAEIRTAVGERGYHTFAADGLKKIRRGITTVEEVANAL